MQISLDIRGHDETTPYGRFILQTLSYLIEPEGDKRYILYTNQNAKTELPSNVQIVSAPQKKDKLLHQLRLKKKLEQDGSHLYIFFDECVPYGFKKDFFVLIPSLVEVFFPRLGFIEKIIYQRYLQTTLKNATQILCFEKNTLLELNERLNVPEQKISIIPGFFPDSKTENPDSSINKLNISAKYNLEEPYILYDSGNRSNSNFERVLKILAKLEKSGQTLNLLVISEEISKEVSFRQNALDMGIEKIVHFIGDIPKKEEIYYYTQSSGVIFPSIYESFPFEFSKAIMYDTPIIASDLKSTKEIMQDAITYCNCRSTSESTKQVQDFITRDRTTNIYKKLFDTLNPESTNTKIQEHIKSWEQSSGK